MLEEHRVAGKLELMSWEPIDNVPQKSGHYVVGHLGRVFGTAYFNAGEQKISLPLGWSQIPNCSPTHWLNSTYDLDSCKSTYRIWPDTHSNWNEYLPPRFNQTNWNFSRASFWKRLKMAFTGILE